MESKRNFKEQTWKYVTEYLLLATVGLTIAGIIMVVGSIGGYFVDYFAGSSVAPPCVTVFTGEQR